jgi:hypothetical protein
MKEATVIDNLNEGESLGVLSEVKHGGYWRGILRKA